VKRAHDTRVSIGRAVVRIQNAVSGMVRALGNKCCASAPSYMPSSFPLGAFVPVLMLQSVMQPPIRRRGVRCSHADVRTPHT